MRFSAFWRLGSPTGATLRTRHTELGKLLIDSDPRLIAGVEPFSFQALRHRCQHCTTNMASKRLSDRASLLQPSYELNIWSPEGYGNATERVGAVTYLISLCLRMYCCTGVYNLQNASLTMASLLRLLQPMLCLSSKRWRNEDRRHQWNSIAAQVSVRAECFHNKKSISKATVPTQLNAGSLDIVIQGSPWDWHMSVKSSADAISMAPPTTPQRVFPRCETRANLYVPVKGRSCHSQKRREPLFIL